MCRGPLAYGHATAVRMLRGIARSLVSRARCLRRGAVDAAAGHAVLGGDLVDGIAPAETTGDEYGDRCCEGRVVDLDRAGRGARHDDDDLAAHLAGRPLGELAERPPPYLF